MEIGKIVGCGVFDSKRSFGTDGKRVSALREVIGFELDLILSADPAATSFINEHSCKLFPGLLIFRKPGQTSHSILHYRCYCLHLSVQRESPIYEEIASLPDYYTFIHEAAYRTIFEALISHLVRRGNAKGDHFIDAKLHELIYLLKKDGERNLYIRRRSTAKENRSVQHAISYIKENFSKEISLAELALLVGYSPNHVQRIFTEIMGSSPREYLEGVRVEHAKYLLAQNEKSLSEIAQDCGFSTQSYFSKIFRRHTFISPGEFRKNTAFRISDGEANAFSPEA